jgi:DNA-sulfur modification-associated
MPSLVPALADINIPPQVNIVPTSSFDALMTEMGRRSIGYSGRVFFGTAFIQGTRLQFTTAMPFETLLDISKIDQSSRRDTVSEVIEHSNRPRDPGHSKQVRSYLLGTACVGEKFILPSFTLNYGVGLDDDAPRAELILYMPTEGSIAWAAGLYLPADARLDTTDGAHRRGELDGIMTSKITTEQKDALRRNAADVKIVFETNRTDSHQDFADCGKAKAIPRSLVTTFDVRDERNRRSRELVHATPFLAAYVDATATNVNLSGKSRMVWSMSAVRMFISHVADRHPDPELTVEAKTAGADKFFAALAGHLPQLRALDQVRNERHPAVTTGQLRDLKGGDVALRGVAMAIFARAFLHCFEHNLEFNVMAARLANIEWHLLDRERSELPSGPEFRAALLSAVRPIWAPLLVMGEERYRVSSSSSDADAAWSRIVEQLFGVEYVVPRRKKAEISRDNLIELLGDL